MCAVRTWTYSHGFPLLPRDLTIRNGQWSRECDAIHNGPSAPDKVARGDNNEMEIHCLASRRVIIARSIRFLRALREACGRTFTIHEGSVLDYPLEVKYDVVLALSVFHQFVGHEADLERLAAFLERLTTDNLVIEAFLPDGPRSDGAYRKFGPEEFVTFVAERSSLRSVTPLRNAEGERPIYLLRR